MPRLALTSFAVLAAALAGPAAGQDPNATYTITFHKEKAGDKTAITKTDRKRMQVEATVNGMPVKQDQTEAEAFAYTQTVIDKPDAKKKPTKLVRDYTKAEATRGGATTALPFAGKTVLIEKGAGGYAFQIKGGAAVTGEDAKALADEFRKEADDDSKFLPKGPVKVGETWPIDVKAFADPNDRLPLDPAKSKGTGRLTRVYQKDGHQFGVIELTMDMVTMGDAEGTIRFAGTLDVCIDGAVNAGRMVMKATGTLNLKIPNAGTAKVTMDMSGEETRTPVR